MIKENILVTDIYDKSQPKVRRFLYSEHWRQEESVQSTIIYLLYIHVSYFFIIGYSSFIR